ncbi:hypothetical protein Q31b_35350 [Novipirellula aureliae]|uniref:Uncharacterized protein n=1 Tax=Novipirellula aureliae TaxID=2527966 RepID=A0A5C6DU28_9BACT|nr:hypothetical protein [Novipirellula aureliae]TWU40190.1 hypothetical protein Q31b_35350 [Novipirellula aureliae]
MAGVVELFRNDFCDSLRHARDYVKANAAMEPSTNDVLLRARQHNTPIVVWRDGKVVELDPFSLEFGDVREEQPPANEK